jgi:hypothetical protein
MTEHEPPRSESLELTTDEVYDYLGYSNCESRCRVRFYEAPGLSPVFLVEELQDNPGTSITNMVEYLAAELAARHCPQRLEEPEPFRWIERYPRTESERRQGMVEYSLVTFASYRPTVVTRWGRRRRKLGKADWRYVDGATIEQLLEGLPSDRGEDQLKADDFFR